MSNHVGNQGKVLVGSNLVAELTGFSWDRGITIVSDTELTDSDETHKTGTKNGTGTIECWWDETDTLAQAAMEDGASVTLALKPEGNVTGDTIFTFTTTIHQISMAVAKDSIITQSFSFTVNGPVTKSIE